MSNTNVQITAEEPRFSYYCDQWLELCRQRLKVSTHYKYSGIVNKYLKPEFGNLPLPELTTQRVDALYAKLIGEYELALTSAKNVLSVLGAVVKYTARVCPMYAPRVLIDIPRVKQPEARVLTVDEQKRLTAYLRTDMDACKFGVLLAMHTGLRIGELCALRWKDISLRNRTISVSASLQRIPDTRQESGGRTMLHVGSTKSSSSQRVIPVSERVMLLIRRAKQNAGECYILTGTLHCMEPRLLQYHFKVYTEACGLKNVHFHTLRHTFATHCVEVGFEVKSLSEILGHSSTKVTLDRYVHSSMDLKRRNMRRLSNVGL